MLETMSCYQKYRLQRVIVKDQHYVKLRKTYFCSESASKARVSAMQLRVGIALLGQDVFSRLNTSVGQIIDMTNFVSFQF